MDQRLTFLFPIPTLPLLHSFIFIGVWFLLTCSTSTLQWTYMACLFQWNNHGLWKNLLSQGIIHAFISFWGCTRTLMETSSIEVLLSAAFDSRASIVNSKSSCPIRACTTPHYAVSMVIGMAIMMKNKHKEECEGWWKLDETDRITILAQFEKHPSVYNIMTQYMSKMH